MYDAQTRHLYSELFAKAEADAKNKLAAEVAPVLVKHTKPKEK